ncbi:hypothetical protein F8388_025720 [Cannabis sativa]|uniref:Uncharacterized protein n=1 Tax=Cannabis sativa TaxID=3483 RepID=A0A7J6F9D9_CANSA|nr:hypothetical protein G4B88_023175 [Cannabis sativa]KAF4367302.1 hypothetical protein F8388_025720 [Cannabis sativa]
MIKDDIEKDMTTLNVFVNYDGHWDDNKCYVDFKMTGILVPKDTTYKKLLGLLSKELNIKPSEQSITVQYQVSPGSPPITILTDGGVLFYLELKKKDPVLTGFPLCITVEDRRLAVNNPALPINQVQPVEQPNEIANGEEQDESNHLNAMPTPTNSDNHTSDNHIFDDVYDSPMEVETVEAVNKNDHSILTRSRALREAKASSSKRRPYKKRKLKRLAVNDFEYYMKQLDNIDVGIRPYLAEVGHEKWSRAFFTGGRYSIMTANIAESMNIVDGSAREMPVAALVEWLINWTEKWFTEKRQEAESTVTVLAAATEKVLRENQVAALPLVVTK